MVHAGILQADGVDVAGGGLPQYGACAIKPQPELQRQGFFQLGVEVYGGALLAPGSTVTCRWPAA